MLDRFDRWQQAQVIVTHSSGTTSLYANVYVTFDDSPECEPFARQRELERSWALQKRLSDERYWAIGLSRMLAIAELHTPPLTLPARHAPPPPRARRLGPRRTARHMTWKTKQRNAPTKGVFR